MTEVEENLENKKNNQNNEVETETDVLAAETVNENSQNKKFNMIISYGKEIVCILALILTTYASQNSPPKFSKAPSPKPFFPKGSLVSDFPFGQLMPTQTKVSLSELSFVLYYAPWCTESQYSRTAYEHVARLFYREAHFAAINCWQPGGECKSHYTKVQSWPILMAYHPTGNGIQYNKNLWTKSALTKFVTAMMNPFKRLTSPDDLLEIMTSKDAVMVAFLDLERDKKQYNVFQKTSMKWLERDPFQEIGFGVVTGDSALAFGVEVSPTIRLYLWNETIEYSGNSSWTSLELTRWLADHLQQVTLWLSPPGTKSSSLAPFLKQGPVLLLFTPRNLYQEQSNAYIMLRQVGMEYYNCANDSWITEMARVYLSQRRQEIQDYNRELQNKCVKYFKEFEEVQQQDASSLKRCGKSIPVSFVHVLNSSKNIDKKSSNILGDFCEVDSKMDKLDQCGCDGSKTNEEESCSAPKRNFFKQQDKDLFKTSMLNPQFDYRSSDRLKTNSLRGECELLHLSQAKYENFYYPEGNFNELSKISGLACNFNSSFSLIAIDSLQFHTFAERLGIDILTWENQTAAVIMDHEYESTYLMKEPATVASLSKFLMDFHRGSLPRFLRTNSVQYKHTHFFNTNELINEREKKVCKVEKPTKVHKKCSKSSINKDKGYVTIKEINSEDFEESVINSNKTSVVYFYSSQCAFCSMISHSLLTVSRILEKLPNIEFLRIDGDKNDLAWQYTMPEFPSLIVFPSHHKADSRKFSVKSKINVQNILGFILANLNRPMRLHGILLSCLSSKRLTSVEDCVEVLRNEISDNISICLKEWRKHSRKRRFLRILQSLKSVYLNLYKIRHSCDFERYLKNINNFYCI